MYRYNILDEARKRALQMDSIGALYSWCSISGEECSVNYEAATAQYHLQSDIAYTIWRYFSGTGDIEFLCDYGAEIVFETARFLYDRGKFIPSKGFCINCVCGPDEYACGVNNNCYTNTLVQWHFGFACQIYDMMSREYGDKFASLAKKIKLGIDERERWQKAAAEMYLPYNAKLGIDVQDDSFLYNDPVDMNIIPQNVDLRKYFHPLNLWRQQVIKQADVVLLMFIFSWKYSKARKCSNYEFYEPLTCHGSSLSPSIHCIIASEIGKYNDAYEYFMHSAYMDVCDLKCNTSGGIHTASNGGTWMAVVNGFAGMRDEPDGLKFNPTLPASWKSYSFKLRYKGRIISVNVNKNQVVY
jgi:alpha,alpha-trehalose phosphorylase